MSRKHYKPRKKRAKEHAPDVKLHAESVTDSPQMSRGESLKPATHGGYRHTFSYYEVTIPAKGKGTCY